MPPVCNRPEAVDQCNIIDATRTLGKDIHRNRSAIRGHGCLRFGQIKPGEPVGKDVMTENHDRNRAIWRFFDGAVSISISMLAAVLVTDCTLCGQLPALGWLKGLTERDDGIIIVATLRLFLTTAALYGGFNVFFVAKEADEKRAKAKGRKEERERIQRELAVQGMPLTHEQVAILTRESE